MFRSGYGLPLQYPDQHVVKVKSLLLKHKPAEFIKVSKTKQTKKVKNINYLDLSGQCSKVIDFGQRHEKKGRPGHKKVIRSKGRLCEKKKSQKKQEVHCQTESKVGDKEVVLETEVVQLPDNHVELSPLGAVDELMNCCSRPSASGNSSSGHPQHLGVIQVLTVAQKATTTVTVLDKEQWEKRKKSIKAKLVLRREHLLTKDEEQDIHMRADVYAITTVPDSAFYVLPEYDCLPRAPMPVEEITINTTYPAVRKKRRRNYGSTNCYVHYHNEEDVYDNTRMLPIGIKWF